MTVKRGQELKPLQVGELTFESSSKSVHIGTDEGVRKVKGFLTEDNVYTGKASSIQYKDWYRAILEYPSDNNLLDLRVYGKTIQSGTPSTTTPSSIDSISPFIRVDNTNKNLFYLKREDLVDINSSTKWAEISSNTYKLGPYRGLSVTADLNKQTLCFDGSYTSGGNATLYSFSKTDINPIDWVGYEYISGTCSVNSQTYLAIRDENNVAIKTVYPSESHNLYYAPGKIWAFFGWRVGTDVVYSNFTIRLCGGLGYLPTTPPPFSIPQYNSLPVLRGLEGTVTNNTYIDTDNNGWYSDYLSLQSGSIIRQTGFQVISNSGWDYEQEYGFMHKLDYSVNPSLLSLSISSSFEIKEEIPTSEDGFYISGNTLYVRYLDKEAGDKETNLTAFNTWISSNPLTVAYPLSESYEEDIDTDLLNSLRSLYTYGNGTSVISNAFFDIDYYYSLVNSIENDSKISLISGKGKDICIGEVSNACLHDVRAYGYMYQPITIDSSTDLPYLPTLDTPLDIQSVSTPTVSLYDGDTYLCRFTCPNTLRGIVVNDGEYDYKDDFNNKILSDYFSYRTKTITRKFERVFLDGTEEWSCNSSIFSLILAREHRNVYGGYFSTHFSYSSGLNEDCSFEIVTQTINDEDVSVLKVRQDNIAGGDDSSKLTNFKSVLANLTIPVQIVYPLLTPYQEAVKDRYIEPLRDIKVTAKNLNIQCATFIDITIAERRDVYTPSYKVFSESLKGVEVENTNTAVLTDSLDTPLTSLRIYGKTTSGTPSEAVPVDMTDTEPKVALLPPSANVCVFTLDNFVDGTISGNSISRTIDGLTITFDPVTQNLTYDGTYSGADTTITLFDSLFIYGVSWVAKYYISGTTSVSGLPSSSNVVVYSDLPSYLNISYFSDEFHNGDTYDNYIFRVMYGAGDAPAEWTQTEPFINYLHFENHNRGSIMTSVEDGIYARDNYRGVSLRLDPVDNSFTENGTVSTAGSLAITANIKMRDFDTVRFEYVSGSFERGGEAPYAMVLQKPSATYKTLYSQTDCDNSYYNWEWLDRITIYQRVGCSFDYYKYRIMAGTKKQVPIHSQMQVLDFDGIVLRGLQCRDAVTWYTYIDENNQKWYSDYIDFEKGKIYRYIVKLVLNGEGQWTKASAYNYFSLNLWHATRASVNTYIQSSHFSNSTATSAVNMDDKSVYLNSSGSLSIRYNSFTTATQFTDYLKAQKENNTPVVIYYPVETPYEETIPQHIIDKYKAFIAKSGHTIASNTHFTSTYMRDYKSYIDEKIAQLALT